METKTLSQILESDVYSPEFLIAFLKMLEKFTAEYDDMAQMEAMTQASELLETFNNQ